MRTITGSLRTPLSKQSLLAWVASRAAVYLSAAVGTALIVVLWATITSFQHFPKENSITISLSDLGLGIPDKVREKIKNITDSDAIIQAVQDGFTTKSKPTNKGVGLDYLLKAVVLQNGGQVTFYSSQSIVRFDRDGTLITSTVFPDVGFCPGTTIDIVIRTDTIEVLPEEREDLQW